MIAEQWFLHISFDLLAFYWQWEEALQDLANTAWGLGSEDDKGIFRRVIYGES